MKLHFLLLFLVGMMLISCASQVYVDPMQIDSDQGAGYSDTDLRMLAEKMTRSLIEMDFIARAGRRVRFAILDIYNKTAEHIDTKAISDKIMVTLLKSGNVSFVDREKLTEMANERHLVSAGNINFSQAIEVGKVLGADYFLAGDLAGIARRQGRTTTNYMKLTLRLIDAKTSEIIWADEKEIKKVSKSSFLD